MASFTPVDYNPFAQPEKPKQTFLQGMELGAKKRALGIFELGANAADALGVAPESTAYAKQLIADVGQDYARQGTGTGLKGGIAEIAGDPLSYIPAASFAKILGQGALMGATAPTGDVDSSLSNNALNAAGGAVVSGIGRGVGNVASRVANPVVNQLGAVGKRGLAELEKAGVPLTAAQKTGSKALAGLESVFATLPTTSSKQNKIFSQQKEAFTRAALQKAGINADTASREVLAKAAKSFGDEYSALAKNNVMNVDEPLLMSVADIYQEATSGRLGQDASGLVKSVAKEIYDAGDNMSGEVYQKTRSLLTQKANSTNDSFDAGLMKRLRNELDSAFERSLPESQRGLMAGINQRYQAFKPIQKAMESSKTDVLQSGYIDPTALYQQVEVGAPLSNLADAGAAFLRPTIPDSGTAQRALMQNLVTGAGVASAGYGAASDNNYALAAGAALAGPRVLQAGYNAPRVQNYLTQGLGKTATTAAQGISAALPRGAASAFSGARAAPAPSTQPQNFTPVDYDPFAGEQVDYDPFASPTTTVVEPLSYNSQQPVGDVLSRIKQAESGGNPNAKNPLSSASGLYQFTDATWRSAVDKWGRSQGIKYSDKNNPQAQEMLMQKLTADNSRILRAKGIEPTDGNIYFAHFMGAPAASKAISLLGKNAVAARSFPEAAKANPTVFFDGQRPRTVDEVYQLITSKVV
jgi:hypothetical protein